MDIENTGVAPDIEVENTAAEGISGNDAQLERAVKEALWQLDQHPSKRVARLAPIDRTTPYVQRQKRLSGRQLALPRRRSVGRQRLPTAALALLGNGARQPLCGIVPVGLSGMLRAIDVALGDARGDLLVFLD